MKFIDILHREVTNTDHIYLYPEADGWCAYEQSACRLNQLTDNCRVEKVISRPYQLMLIRTVLEEDPIHCHKQCTFLFKHDLHLHKEGYLEVFLPRQAEILFERWKACRLAGIEHAVEIVTL